MRSSGPLGAITAGYTEQRVPQTEAYEDDRLLYRRDFTWKHRSICRGSTFLWNVLGEGFLSAEGHIHIASVGLLLGCV